MLIEELMEKVNSRHYPYCGNCYVVSDDKLTPTGHCEICYPKALNHEKEWRKKYAAD